MATLDAVLLSYQFILQRWIIHLPISLARLGYVKKLASAYAGCCKRGADL